MRAAFLLIVVATLVAPLSSLDATWKLSPPTDCSGNPIPCRMGCVRTQGYWGNWPNDPTWQIIPPGAGFCNHTYFQGITQNFPNGLEQLRNLYQQYAAAILNLGTWGCGMSTGNATLDWALTASYNILSDPRTCTDTTNIYSQLVQILTDFNEGKYAGMPACTNSRLSPSVSHTPSCSSTPSMSATRTSSPSNSATPSTSLSNTPSNSATPSETATPSSSLSNTPSATPTPSATSTSTASESSTPSASSSPTGTRTSSPSLSATVTPSTTSTSTATASATPLPSASSTSTVTLTPTPTPSASASHTAGVSSTATPSRSPTSSASKTPAPSAACTVGCTLTVGYYKNHLTDHVWKQVAGATLCGYTYQFVISSSNINGAIPVHWLNLARQWVAVTLNLLRAGCSTPMPAEVAAAYEQASLLLADPTLCSSNDDTWETLTAILDNYNKGLYSSAGGPPHCDSVEPATMMQRRQDTTTTTPQQPSQPISVVDAGAHCCVRNDWSVQDFRAQFDVSLFAYGGCSSLRQFVNSGRLGAVWLQMMLNRHVQCSDVVSPQLASDSARRLDYVAQTVDYCASPVQYDAQMESSIDDVDEWNQGDTYALGGPCGCNDTVCAAHKRAFSSHPAKSLLEVIPAAAQWSLGAQIAIVATLGTVGILGWVLFASTLLIVSVVALVRNRSIFVTRWRRMRGSDYLPAGDDDRLTSVLATLSSTGDATTTHRRQGDLEDVEL